MKVSVLMAVYNGERTLRQTIESVLNQTYTNLELVIVNDGSTDKSEAIIKSFTDKRIQYFSQKNSGSPAGPRNVAARQSSGDVFALCDQDDLWYPEKLERQISLFSEKFPEEVGIVYTRADFIDREGRKIGLSELPNGYTPAKMAHEKLLLGIFITACSAIFTKKAYQYAGGFDEGLKGNDEYDLWLKITKKFAVFGLPDTLCAWRSTGHNVSTKISNLYVENQKIFTKLKGEDRELLERAEIKNINRIVVSSLMEKDYKRAKEYAILANKYHNNVKATLIIKLTLINSSLARLIVRILKKLGKVSY